MRKIFSLSAEFNQGRMNERQQAQEARVTKMTITIVAVFVFCNAFESIVWILASQEMISLDLVQNYLRPLADLLMTINSSVNIVIYSYFNKEFKEKFWEMYLKNLQRFCKKEQGVIQKPVQKTTTTSKRTDHSIEMKSLTTKCTDSSNNSSPAMDVSVVPKTTSTFQQKVF